MPRADRIAFVKLGRFSHTNESVLDLLRTQFPEFTLDVIDVRELDVFRPRKLAPLAWAALRQHGPATLANKASFVKSLLHTPQFQARARASLLARLQRTRYRFTFQTQSLFDASVPGTPHFLYTDHTHLANLKYPAFDPRGLAPPQWIDGERATYRHATINFTMSTNIARSLIEQYSCREGQVQCVYVGTNAPPAAESSPCRPQQDDEPAILFVGLAWERKGGPALVEAFKRVLRRHPAAQLVIVGCSPRINVDHCTVVGRVPLEQVNEHYRRASVFCVPTRIEPLGIVFLEAFAHGLPVVATRIGALPDFVHEGQTGYLVEPDDVEALAAHLCDLLCDPQKRRLFGQRGCELVRTRYNWEATGRAIRESVTRHL